MIEVDNRQGLDDELEKDEKVLALFYAGWCPYCVRFVPAFKKKAGSFTCGRVIHVILDDYNNPLWDEYEIGAVPTVIYFEKGKVAKRLDGRSGVGLTENQLDSWLKQL
jgi:thiol-disulfide isomerase/thioredoxin